MDFPLHKYKWQYCSHILPQFIKQEATEQTHKLHFDISNHMKGIEELPRKEEFGKNDSKEDMLPPYAVEGLQKSFLENSLSEKCWNSFFPAVYKALAENIILTPEIVYSLFLNVLTERDYVQVENIANVLKLHLKYHPASKQEMKSFYRELCCYNTLELSPLDLKKSIDMIQKLKCDPIIENEMKMVCRYFLLRDMDPPHFLELSPKKKKKKSSHTRRMLHFCNMTQNELKEQDHSVQTIDDEKSMQQGEIFDRLVIFLELWLAIMESESNDGSSMKKKEEIGFLPSNVWVRHWTCPKHQFSEACFKLFINVPDNQRPIFGRLINLLAKVTLGKGNYVKEGMDYFSSAPIYDFASTLAGFMDRKTNCVAILKDISTSWLQFLVSCWILNRKKWLKNRNGIALLYNRKIIFISLLRTLLDSLQENTKKIGKNIETQAETTNVRIIGHHLQSKVSDAPGKRIQERTKLNLEDVTAITKPREKNFSNQSLLHKEKMELLTLAISAYMKSHYFELTKSEVSKPKIFNEVTKIVYCLEVLNLNVISSKILKQVACVINELSNILKFHRDEFHIN